MTLLQNRIKHILNNKKKEQQAYLNAQIQEKESYEQFVKIRPDFEV